MENLVCMPWMVFRGRSASSPRDYAVFRPKTGDIFLMGFQPK